MGMTEVRCPRLLDSSRAEKARLHPVSLSLQLSLEETNQATMVLAEDEVSVGLHDWIEIYTQNGSAGIYRVTGIQHDYTKQTTLTLLHVIDTLTDQIYPGEVEFSGTIEAFLRDVLSRQTNWVLGTCEDPGNYVASVSFENLRTLLKGVQSHEKDYYFVYNTSSFPWTLSLLRRPEAVANEFRLARNVQSCNITMDDSDLCTRLYLAIDTDTNNTDTGVKTTSTTMSVFDDVVGQSTYGIVAKTSSINTADYPDPAAYAQRFLADRSKPHVQITIDGRELYQITGDLFDELKLGQICRVALPDYGDVFSERIISITYPDLTNDPEQVTVELADSAYSAVSTISALASTAQATAAAQSTTAKTTATQIHTAKADLIKTDGVLHEAGIELDPTGVFVFAKADGALGKALSFVDVTATGGRVMFTDAFEKDASGKLVVKSASGMSYRKNNVEVGLFDNDNLTAGVLVEKLSDGVTKTKISSDWIDIAGDQTIIRTKNFIGAVTGVAEADWDSYSGVTLRQIDASTLWMNRNDITGVVGEFEIVGEGTNRRVVVKSGGGLKIKKNNTEFGLYDEDNLTAGVMVSKINNDQTVAKILASRVDLGAYATVGQLEAEVAQIESLYVKDADFRSALAGDITCMSLGASQISGDNVSGTWATFASCEVNGHNVGSDTILNGTPTSSASGGVITLTFPTMGGSTSVNFNIADTQYYKDGVAAAEQDGYDDGYETGFDHGKQEGTEEGYTDGYNDGVSEGYSSGYSAGVAAGKLEGWNAAALNSGVNPDNSASFPRSGTFGDFYTKRPSITGYTASSYTKESVSYQRSYHSLSPSAYVKETTVNRDGVIVLVNASSYRKETDSYSPSYYSYTESSYTASSPGSITWS
jgi:hypothetical protein